ncbi:MAG: J domain-containing protein [Campylobacterota bacterium]|nr:J domain-containing protein [Campylobacterota bacterium]
MIPEEYIIYNPTLGVRDFVMIDEESSNATHGWLEYPYEMVGPFCLDELKTKGIITFAQCYVISKAKWQQEQHSLQQEALRRQRKVQKEHYEEIRKYNQRSKNRTQQEHRELLSLPLDEVLDEAQIKDAYRSICKSAHPDVGGDHEYFILITQARDVLLEVFG